MFFWIILELRNMCLNLGYFPEAQSTSAFGFKPDALKDTGDKDTGVVIFILLPATV
jgi:hypothetical protein